MKCRQNVVGIELKFQGKSFHPKFIKNESVWQTAKAPRRQGLFSLASTFDVTYAIITGVHFLVITFYQHLHLHITYD